MTLGKKIIGKGDLFLFVYLFKTFFAVNLHIVQAVVQRFPTETPSKNMHSQA